jgi:hypothetical protein
MIGLKSRYFLANEGKISASETIEGREIYKQRWKSSFSSWPVRLKKPYRRLLIHFEFLRIVISALNEYEY